MDKNKSLKIRAAGSFSLEERRAIVNEYLSGNYTKTAIWRKYTSQEQEHGYITRWMRQLGLADQNKITFRMGEKNVNFVTKASFLPLANADSNKTPEQLQAEIRALKKQLESAELKAEGYRLMIEIAEKEFKIPIRKKPNTK